ncbi:MAG: peptide-methionine (S)-S-oxide reductase MsrA [Marinirhabdus sp.]
MDDNLEKVVFANGCFWCTEAVFQRIKGVKKVTSGYTGGTVKNPAYREVCTGRTGHAEGIELVYDPAAVTFRTLLEVFFATHDPTTLNRQGNDVGTQYRSEIFWTTRAQKEEARAYVRLLESKQVFNNPIVTAVTALGPFYRAEKNHREYYNNNTAQPYCSFVITPKVEKIKEYFADKLK